jgi:hypothetical protein
MEVQTLPCVSLQAYRLHRAHFHVDVCEYRWVLHAALNQMRLSGPSEERLRATRCVSHAMSHNLSRASGGRHTWSEIPLVGSKYASSSFAFPTGEVSSMMVLEDPEPSSTP